MLKIENASKSFGKKQVLNDLNLVVEDGSVFGLVGINGAGKSTLLRCIAGGYQLEAGDVLFDGKDTYSKAATRKDIILVGEELYFAPNSSIKSNKDYYETFYNFDEEKYQKYLKMFHLDENAQISTFSKGMKRQTGLLYALSVNPKLLLLDECFDGLDPLIRLTFKHALVDLIEDREITVIIASHNLKELEDICDSFGILEDGQINTYGDLLESKENVKKYQLVFDEVYEKSDFNDFDLLSYRKEGVVYTLVIKGDQEEVETKLKARNPRLINELPVNFEELFIYEVESRGLLDE